MLFTLVFRRGPCCSHSCLGEVRVVHTRVLVLCVVFFVFVCFRPVLPVSLDCSRPVSYVPNVVSVSGLFILDNTFSFL